MPANLGHPLPYFVHGIVQVSLEEIMATNGDDKKLLKDLSNSIKDLVAPDPPQGQPITQCFVMKTGFTINPANYEGKEGPLHLAQLFNDIPKISASWETSGKQISSLWEILLKTGKAPYHPPPKNLEKAYEEAIIKLYGSRKKFNHVEKSAFYASLDTLRNNVVEKQLKLLGLNTTIKTDIGPDASQAEFDSVYQQMSPTYVDAVKSAQQELLIRQREIDRYTTVLFAYNTGSLETVLSNFNTSKLRDDSNFKTTSRSPNPHSTPQQLGCCDGAN